MPLDGRNQSTTAPVELPRRNDVATTHRPKFDLAVRVLIVSSLASYAGLYSKLLFAHLGVANFDNAVNACVLVLAVAGLSKVLAPPLRLKSTFALSILAVALAAALGLTPV